MFVSLLNRPLPQITVINARQRKDKCNKIMNDWNYDANCTLPSLLVLDLENFKCSIFVAQSVLYISWRTEENHKTLSSIRSKTATM
jgi:hypothetical protein